MYIGGLLSYVGEAASNVKNEKSKKPTFPRYMYYLREASKYKLHNGVPREVHKHFQK